MTKTQELEVVAWMDETSDAAPGAKGVTEDAYTAAYWEDVSGQPMTELIRASDANAIIKGLEAESGHWAGEARRLLKSGQDALEALEAAEAERDALQRKLDLHEAALSFVHRWAVQKEGNGTSAEERMAAIAHHPAIQALEASK